MEGVSSQHKSVTAYQLCSDKNLSILFYNARSLLPKFDELCAVCENNKITDSEISLPDYQLYRLDCNRHGGGVLMHVHNNYMCKVLLTGPAQLECLLISIYRNCHRINIDTFYCQPNSSAFIEHFFQFRRARISSGFSSFVLRITFVTHTTHSTPKLYCHSHYWKIFSWNFYVLQNVTKMPCHVIQVVVQFFHRRDRN